MYINLPRVNEIANRMREREHTRTTMNIKKERRKKVDSLCQRFLCMRVCMYLPAYNMQYFPKGMMMMMYKGDFFQGSHPSQALAIKQLIVDIACFSLFSLTNSNGPKRMIVVPSGIAPTIITTRGSSTAIVTMASITWFLTAIFSPMAYNIIHEWNVY